MALLLLSCFEVGCKKDCIEINHIKVSIEGENCRFKVKTVKMDGGNISEIVAKDKNCNEFVIFPDTLYLKEAWFHTNYDEGAPELWFSRNLAGNYVKVKKVITPIDINQSIYVKKDNIVLDSLFIKNYTINDTLSHVFQWKNEKEKTYYNYNYVTSDVVSKIYAIYSNQIFLKARLTYQNKSYKQESATFLVEKLDVERKEVCGLFNWVGKTESGEVIHLEEGKYHIYLK